MFIWDAVGSYQNLDPEYMEQWKRESLLRLEAKDRRQNKQSVDNKLSKRQKKSKQTKDELVQYLVKIDKFDPDTGIVDKRFLDEAIMSVTECIDPRTIAKRLEVLIIDGQIEEAVRDSKYKIVLNDEETE
jgi:hypothetical protein